MTAKYTQGLIIDGTTYQVPLVSIKRTLDFLEKFAERTEDGDIQIETIGYIRIIRSRWEPLMIPRRMMH